MPLSLEQFKKLREKGLTVQQIASFEAGKIPQQPKEPNLGDKIVNSKIARTAQNLQDFGVGIAKGAASTVKGAADLGEKLLSPVGKLTDKIFGLNSPKAGKATDIIPSEIYTPQNSGEKLGFGVEQIAEFLVPVGAIGKAQKAVGAAVDATKLKTLSKIGSKVLGKAGVEAAGGAGVRALQTGGDVKESLKTGALFGGTKLATGAIGETLRATKVPEWFYSKIFKNTKSDMFEELKTLGIQNIQKQHPEQYKQFVDAGLIKVGKNGQAVLDETLAKEALDRGLKGSITNMSRVVVKQNLESELKIRNIAQTSKELIKIPEKSYINVLKEIAKDYKDVSFGQVTKQAGGLANKLQTGRGVLNVEDTLALRRLLDKLRIQSSYSPVANTKMSLSQQNLKSLTDRLRPKLNAVSGMGETMKDYTFGIEALETLASEAARRGNREALSFIDTMLFSGGFAAGSPGAGAGISVIRKILNSPAGLTSTAQKIQKGGSLTKLGSVAKGAISQVSNGE